MAMLGEAIRALAARCDGAIEKDARGFNGADTYFGHQLAALPDERWTLRQQRAAWAMLRKYAGQLGRMGMAYEDIPEPAKPDATVQPPRLILILQGKEEKEVRAFVIKFPYDPGLVAGVKTVPGASWDRENKRWTVPTRLEVLEPLMRFATANGFEFGDAVVDTMSRIAEVHQEKITASRAVDADLHIEGLGGELRPFQKAGVAYAMKAKRCFIADEMGLGKTVEALATIQAANAYPALVVCPASLKLNWEREAKKWLPGRTVAVLNGGKNGDSLPEVDVTILNYDILKKWLEPLKARGFQAFIADESHFLKAHTAQRTQYAKDLAKGIPIRLALTGTPILNRPQELLSQLQILGRLDDLGGFWGFAKRYCGAYKSRWGWDFSGATHLDELNEKLRASAFIRRTKAEVLAELPAKQRAVVPVALSNRPEYDRAERDLVSWLRKAAQEDKSFLSSIADLPPEEQKRRKRERSDEAAQKAMRAEQLVRIEALKQLCAKGKMEAVVEWVESFLETGEKLVIFAHHQEVVRTLAERFQVPSITGATAVEDRQQAVDQFQTDPACKVIVCNIQAGGVGITLTAASNVAFIELAWTPAAHDQAEDRTHRIGQQNQVTAWYLLGEKTIDEEIQTLIETKRQVITAATEGTAVDDRGILSDLIGKLQERR